MTDFSVFNKAVHKRFVELSKHELYITDIGDGIYETYLNSFPAGTNPIFGTRTEYDCNTCKQFIRRLGKLIGLKNGKILTVWENLDLPEPYKTVAEALDKAVRNSKIVTVFRTKEKQYGVEHNYNSKTGEKHIHFFGKVDSHHHTLDPETKRSEQEAIFQVMQRGLNEIKNSDLLDVLDLIESNGLYRGQEYKAPIEGFKTLLAEYKLAKDPNLFLWENLHNRNARFRNSVIGTLFVELAEGKDFETAIKSFESRVAPANYKRPTSLITKKMVDDAVKVLADLGLNSAVERRFAKISDVSVNDVLFVDNDIRGKLKDGIASLLETNIKKSTPDLKKAKKISCDEFVSTVLPKAKSLEVLVENRHQGNFVSLTGADGQERLFKWDNNFAWSYEGDVTDSVKQRVKAAGGNINAKLRVSLSWFNFDDLDLHAILPNGMRIYFGNKAEILDVDMNAHGPKSRNAVENLAFTKLQDGIYSIYVNQFHRRESIDVGFAIEVEFGGAIHQYSYEKAVQGNVQCFKLHVNNGSLTKIETDLVGGSSSQDKWGVKTESLVPVSAVMYSPNYWGENKVGAKHLIFGLKQCKNPNMVRGIYNEFLRSDLEKHRKVFEVLGAKTKCPVSDEQVSGIGFTAARNDSVVVLADNRSYLVSF